MIEVVHVVDQREEQTSNDRFLNGSDNVGRDSRLCVRSCAGDEAAIYERAQQSDNNVAPFATERSIATTLMPAAC